MRSLALMKLVLISVVATMISGCYSVKSVKTGSIIQQDKSMEVPATGFSILDIKAALAKDGWKIKVKNSNVSRSRTDTTNPAVDAHNDYDAAYRLVISESVRFDQFVIGLSASVIDNRTNEEVLSMYFDSKGFGGCWPDEIAQDIVNELHSVEK
jgi:hypothetical protein